MTVTLPSLPLELKLDIIEMVDHQPTLVTLASMCRDFYKSCTPRLWRHLDVRSPKGLAAMILAIASNPKLASYVQSVAFTCDSDCTEAHIDHECERPCLPFCSHTLQEEVKDKLAGVCEGKIDVVTAEKVWSAVELLPEKLLGLLDASPAQRSYALPAMVNNIWYNSFATGSPRTLRCLCSDGSSLYELSPRSDMFEPHALHLYGRPSDWTQHESPSNTSTFARFPGIKLICLSVHTWGVGDDDDCNFFERLSEYDQNYSKGGLEKVVVRVTWEVSAKVCEAFDQYHWPKGRDIVEFRLWDIADMSPDDAVAQELADGTWHHWLKWPKVLGSKHSFESLSNLAKAHHLTNVTSPMQLVRPSVAS